MENSAQLLKIGYNSQRNNIATPVAGPFSQCGYDSMFMFLSYFIPELHASNDQQLYEFVDGMEPSFGTSGFGDDILKKHPEYAGKRLGAYAENYARIAQMYLDRFHIKGEIVFRQGFHDHSGSLEEICEAIDRDSPVFLSTRLTNSGHFILVIGYDKKEKSLIVHDPFGDATTYYRDPDGDARRYHFDFIEDVTEKAEIGWRYIWFKRS